MSVLLALLLATAEAGVLSPACERAALEAAAREMGVALRPGLPVPRVRGSSDTPLAYFQDALEPQWGMRPSAYLNAYVPEREEIFLLEEEDYYLKMKRHPADSLAHEYAHYLQFRYRGAQLADDALEGEAVAVQTAVRERLKAGDPALAACLVGPTGRSGLGPKDLADRRAEGHPIPMERRPLLAALAALPFAVSGVPAHESAARAREGKAFGQLVAMAGPDALASVSVPEPKHDPKTKDSGKDKAKGSHPCSAHLKLPQYASYDVKAAVKEACVAVGRCEKGKDFSELEGKTLSDLGLDREPVRKLFLNTVQHAVEMHSADHVARFPLPEVKAQNGWTLATLAETYQKARATSVQ